MRVLLLTGKGGVGKTTTAAATALHAARLGPSTVVLSTNAARSLAGAPVRGGSVRVRFDRERDRDLWPAS